MRGFLRPTGPAGARDYVAVIPTVGCVNEVARRIAAAVPMARPMLHHQGCCQLPTDVKMVTDVLAGVCRNPNVAAVVLVSLGCESVTAENIVATVQPHKPVELVRVQAMGGITATAERGVAAATRLAASSTTARREVSLSDIVVGVKCGASDTTSGLASNPAVGNAVDRLIDAGATVVFGETTEIIGAEHILVQRARNDSVASQLLACAEAMEARVNAMGVDMRGGQPTEGNIRGGLTTIEEKSLGAIVKSGSQPIDGVIRYGERPGGPGLYFMDSPGREMEFLTGLASAGCQVMLFSTGIGAPQGFSLAPVIKISGNRNTCLTLAEYIDMDVSGIVAGTETLDEAGARVFDTVVRVFSGEDVKAELLEYDSAGVNSNIYTVGPTI
ncbi:MAG: galactonate dehydratase [Dehalococcoidia bacterium]|nr:MAG: galactonate dehydratase [Dehalococcoidia bacterium]